MSGLDALRDMLRDSGAVLINLDQPNENDKTPSAVAAACAEGPTSR